MTALLLQQTGVTSCAREVRADRIAHEGIRRSVVYLLANPGAPLTVADLMRVAGLSARGFHAAFARCTGCAPGRMMRTLRIERAKELLKRGMKMKIVAAECGFRKFNTFEIAFKNATGISPGRFRRQLGRRNGRPIKNGHALAGSLSPSDARQGFSRSPASACQPVATRYL